MNREDHGKDDREEEELQKGSDPLDAGLSAAFADAETTGPLSVLTVIQRKTGDAPHVSLREEDSAVGGASPLIDPRSPEKLALPQGKGNYQLLGEIARGGMGVVLKGHDADLGRDVALKVLHGDLVDKPEILQRFVEEAQIGGQLQHPGIVPVYELGLMADERPYFTMKLVKGRTLATLLAERESVNADRRKLLDVFTSVCQTMAYAHSRGVIHRDLKPANIMVGAFGEVQVVDWGLAKVLARGGVADEKKAKEARTMHTVLETVRTGGTRAGSGSGSDSLVGSVMGTPAYMPPEQACGRVDKLDERSDVFALGAILCEILTGKPPYDGESEKTLIQAAQGELDDALARLDGSQANAELVKLTKQCLMPAAAARPRNAGVLADRIRGHLESIEERARQLQIQAAEMQVRTEEALVHAQNERRARKLTLALAASVVGMVAIGGGGWLWAQNERAARREAAATADLERTERERELDAGVNAALTEAIVFSGQREWDDAYAALERARALAATGESPGERLARIERERSKVDKAHSAALFVEGIDEVEQGVASLFDWESLDEQYARKFALIGIDVDADEPAVVKAKLADYGIGVEVAPKLDRWLVVRRNRERLVAQQQRRPEDLARALRLVDVAHAVDDDPLRADLREALINDDVDMLRVLAEDDLSDQPPSTLALLGTALVFADERDAGMDVLRFGARLHPDDYALRTVLVTNLSQNPLLPSWDREETLEAMRHTQAAIALQPENESHRNNQFWQFLGLAWDAERRGENAEARRWCRGAVLEFEGLPAPVSPSGRIGLAWALDGAGEQERARAAYRAVLDAPPMETSFGRSAEEWAHWFALRASVRLLRLGALEDAERGLEPILAIDTGPAFGEWVLARALQHVREADGEGAARLLSDEAEESQLDLARASNRIAWSVGQLTPEQLITACGASKPTEKERVRPAIAALQAEGLRMSERAVELTPSSVYWHTLGVLRYRHSDLEGALEAFTESMRQKSGGNAHDWYFVAMVQHELGNEPEARAWFERAFAQTATAPVSTRGWGQLFELLAFRSEAETVLGLREDDR